MKTTRSKYNVGKQTDSRSYNGIVFDSAVEMKFYRDVVIPLIHSGDILKCERQKRYVLQPSFFHNGKKIQSIEYKADFYIVDCNGKETTIDIKGCPDAVAKLKRKMFWCIYPNINYIWVGYSALDGGWTTYESIIAGRKQRKKLKQKLKENKDNNEKD